MNSNSKRYIEPEPIEYPFNPYLDLFKSDGSWDESIIGLIPSIANFLTEVPQKWSSEVWLTALMLAFFNKNYGSTHEFEIQLIVKKMKRYIVLYAASNELDSAVVIKKSSDLIKTM